MKIEPYYEGMPEPVGVSIRDKEVIELQWGGKLVFYNCIVGGVIDQRFIPSIQKGVMEKMQEGPITGSFVRDVRVIVYDGKMHPVDSNDISFKIAGMMAFKEAFQLQIRKFWNRFMKLKFLFLKNWWVMWWRIFSRDVPSFLAWIQKEITRW